MPSSTHAEVRLVHTHQHNTQQHAKIPWIWFRPPVHIQADDLANIFWHSLFKAKAQRIYHASDDTDLKMGDYFDLAAEIFNMPKTIRISRDDAQKTLPALQMSFMSESRRLKNNRFKQELRVKLRFPTVKDGLEKTHHILHEQANFAPFNSKNN